MHHSKNESDVLAYCCHFLKLLGASWSRELRLRCIILLSFNTRKAWLCSNIYLRTPLFGESTWSLHSFWHVASSQIAPSHFHATSELHRTLPGTLLENASQHIESERLHMIQGNKMKVSKLHIAVLESPLRRTTNHFLLLRTNVTLESCALVDCHCFWALIPGFLSHLAHYPELEKL